MVLKVDLQIIKTFITPMLGKKTWGARLGCGSFITLEFGNQSLNDKEIGEWHLWIYYCAWYVSKRSKILAACEDSREKITAVINNFNSCSLDDVEINQDGLETKFYFSDDLTLHTFPVSTTEDSEQWMLFMPSNKVLKIGPGVHWIYKNVSDSR